MPGHARRIETLGISRTVHPGICGRGRDGGNRASGLDSAYRPPFPQIAVVHGRSPMGRARVRVAPMPVFRRRFAFVRFGGFVGWRIWQVFGWGATYLVVQFIMPPIAARVVEVVQLVIHLISTAADNHITRVGVIL